ncbi:MAG: histidine kinase [Bacteroidetes bacterium]|nr:histidine kinase [Bacteroidota bacterium]
MKSNFKYILIGIIGCLSIALVFQIFWLGGLYKTIEAETEKSVITCLDEANSMELQERIDSLDKAPKPKKCKGKISIKQSMGSSKEKDPFEKKFTIQRENVVKEGDTIKAEKELDKDKVNVVYMNKILVSIREAIHQTLDNKESPISLRILHSSLSELFVKEEIKSHIYRIEIVNLAKNKVIHTASFSREKEAPSVFNFTYDSDNHLGYRIYIESLTKSILAQMLGILSTTFFIIVIFVFAFWYLIKTIFQQKTLDEMKEGFTNNMTHELNTPIAVAYSATDALLNFGQGENKEKREKYLAISKSQLEKLSGLVEQILSMSMERRTKFVLQKEDVQIKAVLDILVEQHRMKADKKILFNFDIKPHDLTVYADRTHLNNLLSNLIDNAIKYSEEEEARIDVCAFNEANFSVIEVKDNGIGIASDKQKFVFDKFFRVTQGNKHNAKGYGIGLFYVKTIVEKHNGIIQLSSVLGKGSVFTIKIPLK